MTALIIILSVLAFLFVLLCFPLCFHITYKDSYTFTIRYLFFRYRPKKKEEPEDGAEKEKPDKPRDLKKALHYGQEILDLAADIYRLLVKRVVFKRLYLEVGVVGEDAAQTALMYGGVCAGVYPLYGAALQKLKIKKTGLSVYPDYQGKEFTFNLDCYAKISVLFLITSLNRVIIKTIQLLMSQKKEK